MDDEEEESFSENEAPQVDHRGDMRPLPFDTPPMRHLIPIVREVMADIRRTFWDDEDIGADGADDELPLVLRGEMELEVHNLIFRIPTVHPLIAVLKHVLTVMNNEDEHLEESDDEAAPPFLRWNTRYLRIIDVSPDHPLLPTANTVIQLFYWRLLEEDEDTDDYDDNDDSSGDDDSDGSSNNSDNQEEDPGTGAEADIEEEGESEDPDTDSEEDANHRASRNASRQDGFEDVQRCDTRPRASCESEENSPSGGASDRAEEGAREADRDSKDLEEQVRSTDSDSEEEFQPVGSRKRREEEPNSQHAKESSDNSDTDTEQDSQLTGSREKVREGTKDDDRSSTPDHGRSESDSSDPEQDSKSGSSRKRSKLSPRVDERSHKRAKEWSRYDDDDSDTEEDSKGGSSRKRIREGPQDEERCCKRAKERSSDSDSESSQPEGSRRSRDSPTDEEKGSKSKGLTEYSSSDSEDYHLDDT